MNVTTRTSTLLKTILFSLAVIMGTTALAQDKEPENLIANPSFESDNGKIKKLGDAGKTLGAWTTATKTKVDVFSASALDPIVGTPNNSMGKCNPKDGDNYIGIKIYDFNAKGGRGYLTSELVDHLEKDKRYCLSYSISLSDVAKYATNNFGVHFSKKEIYEEESDALIKENVILPMANVVQENTQNWTNICVPFTAKGFEKFITIGNFHTTSKTATKTMRKPKDIDEPQQPVGYYFVDNMKLIPIDRDSDCMCAKEEKLVEGPKIIYSKTEVLSDKASTADVINSGAVYFYSLKSDLVEASKKELNRIADALKSQPSVKVEIGGHSDVKEEERLKQDDTYVDLSEERANAVKDYLVSMGVSASQLTVVGHKGTKPVSKMPTPISLAKNRRVVFTMK